MYSVGSPRWLRPRIPSPSPTLIPDPAALKQLKFFWLGVGNRDPLMRISLGLHTFLWKRACRISGVWTVAPTTPPRWAHNFYPVSAQLLFKE